MKRTLPIISLFVLLVTSSFAQTDTRGARASIPAANTGKEKRLALVVGNSAYQNVTPLEGKPYNDADDLGEALTRLGFEVINVHDANKRQLQKAIMDFSARLERYDVGLFFYAGHGLGNLGGDNNPNYLVPVDFPVPAGLTKADIPFECIDVSWIQNKMSEAGAYNKTNIILLDACRDDGGFRGFRAMNGDNWSPPAKVPTGVLICYATSQGGQSANSDHNVANSRNGLYTSVLLKHIETPNLSVNDLLVRVSADISSKGVQEPETMNKLRKMFYFNQQAIPDSLPTPGELDSDNDGVPDSKDKCPQEYGIISLAGCPDADGDGIADAQDKCPYQKGVLEYAGCPPPKDTDGDGVPDKADDCPTVYGLKQYRGCPDSDGDGIPDNHDNCPKEKGDPDNNGCPSAPAATEVSNTGTSTNFTVQGVNFSFAYVQGGSFTMGCTDEQKGCITDEKPSHNVSVGNYYIGTTEVTQKQYQAIMGTNPSNFIGCDDCPVENVSYEDVKAFIAKLNSLTGKTYRLPTEAEWEYAARGGNKSQHTQYSGSNTIDEVAWYSGNSGSKTHPVAQKKANELGLYDMSGNVYEWCSDWYGSDYYANSPSSNPQGAATGSARVLRGGGWRGSDQYCRVAARDNNYPAYRRNYSGFRLVASSQ